MFLMFCSYAFSWTSQLFPYNGSTGKYETATVNFNSRSWKLLDYSYTGYNLGETPLQTNIPCNILTITGTGDISQELQDKINTVGLAGGGIVKIPAGNFIITQTSAAKPIGINYPNVSVEGAGSSLTKINIPKTHAYSDDANAFEGVFTFEKGYFAWNKGWVDGGTDISHVNNTIAEGSTYITGLTSLTSVTVGSWIVIQQYFWPAFNTTNSNGVWTTSDREYTFTYLRKVLSKDASGITVDAPIPYTLNPANSTIFIKTSGTTNGMLNNVGISGMTISFDDNNNGYNGSRTAGFPSGCAIYFEGVVNGWVKDVTVINFPRYGIHPDYSARITIEDCFIKKTQDYGGGGAGYGFYVNCSQNILIKRCHGEQARHNFILSRALSHYVVMTQCESFDAAESEDTHFGFAHALLRDQFIMGNGNALNGYNRWTTSGNAYESFGTGAVWNLYGDGYQGQWHAAEVNINPSSDGYAMEVGVAGNYKVNDGAGYAPAGTFTSGTVVSNNAGLQVGPASWRQNVLYEGVGYQSGLLPASLYEEQLKNRVGAVADWANVCSEAPTAVPIPTSTSILTPGILVFNSEIPAFGIGLGGAAATPANTLTPGNNLNDMGQNKTINGAESFRVSTSSADWGILANFGGPDMNTSAIQKFDGWVYLTDTNYNFRLQLINDTVEIGSSVVVNSTFADGGVFNVNQWNHFQVPIASFGYSGAFTGIGMRTGTLTAPNTKIAWFDDLYFIPNSIPSPTFTPTRTSTMTNTPATSPTFTPTRTGTPTASVSVTATGTPTYSRTVSATPSYTVSNTQTYTATKSATATATKTSTAAQTATNTPVPTATSGPWGACNKILLAYYYNDGTLPYDSSKIPYNKLTHICHSFVVPNADGSLNYGPSFIEPALIANAHAAGVKVLISIGGGGTNTVCSQMANNPAARNAFENNIVSFIQANGYDGLDMDWELMATPVERANYTLLMTELRSKFNAAQPPGVHWLLTAAIPMTNYYGQWIDYAAIDSSMDFYNLMAYDQHGGWGNHVGYNAPLFANPSDPDGMSDVMGVDYMTVTRGISASKIVMGVPFYGHNYTLYTAPFQTCSAPSCGGAAGTDVVSLNYNAIAAGYIGNGWTYHWDAVSHNPYLTKNTGTGVIVYDDPQSITDKVNYAITTRNLGGVMMWDLSGDYIAWQGQPLLDAMYNAFTAACPSGYTATPTFTITPTYSVTPVWPSVIIYDGDTVGSRLADGTVTNSVNGGGLTEIAGGNAGNGMRVDYIDSAWYSSHTWQFPAENRAGYNYLQFDIKSTAGFVDNFNFLMNWTVGAVNVSNYSPIGIPPYWITIQIPLADLLAPGDTQATFIAFQKLINYPYTVMVDNIRLINMTLPTATPTYTASSTITRTSTATKTLTNTPVISPTFTQTFTGTATATATDTAGSSPTFTATSTSSPASSQTNTPTITPTSTTTPVYSPTATPTATDYLGTPTFTETVSDTATPNPTGTFTQVINTFTQTPQATDTDTPLPPTQTNTPVNTATSTAVSTQTNTPVPPTSTPTKQPTATNTTAATATYTPTATQTAVTPPSEPVIYPNPVNPVIQDLYAAINVKSGPSDVTFRLYTSAFRLVREVKISSVPAGAQLLCIGRDYLKGLSNGVYFISVEQGKGGKPGKPGKIIILK